MADARHRQRRDREEALDGISVAPPAPDGDGAAAPEVSGAKGADGHETLRSDPAHADPAPEIGFDQGSTTDQPADRRLGNAEPAPRPGSDEITGAQTARGRERAG